MTDSQKWGANKKFLDNPPKNYCQQTHQRIATQTFHTQPV
jgi:hypothetical protein